jgi:hypothetical protein
VTDPVTSNEPGAQKRRSTRIVQAVPITVIGVDALGQPFKERTTTTGVNCHGCKYTSKHYVPKNSKVTLEIPRPETSQPARKVQGRVVWVQRPRTVRELFQIGLEFDIAGNVWGIAFPPSDWFPLPDEESAAGSATQPAIEKKTATPAGRATFEDKRPQQILEKTLQKPAAPPHAAPSEAPPAPSEFAVTPAAPAPSAHISLPDEHKIHVVPSPAPPSEESQAALARHMAKLVTDAREALDKSLRHEAQSAINDEMTIVRQQLDAQLHDAVEKAIRISMERVSESTVKKVVQQAADRTNAIVEEARKATETNAEQLDARIRQAVQDAVSGAVEQASREAAQQSVTLNLKQDIEQAVEKAIGEREASSPSLRILTSPEAAQKQIDDWKKTLEETAQAVRQESVQKSEADAQAAAQRWQEEFENALKGASQKVSEQLNEVSQAALNKAGEDVLARHARLRASLDETLAQAQSTASSVEERLAEERARAEATAAQLHEAATGALKQTRQELDDLLTENLQEIARKADEVITEHTRHIEPLVEQSAQRVAERISHELNQNVTAKLEEARKAASELGETRQQLEQFRESMRSEVQHASDQVARLHDTVREEILQASEQAFQIQGTVREQVAQASEAAIQEALARLKDETSKYPQQLEQSSSEVVSKVETELEQKSTAIEHATYEALLKASEWYQKKAHTTMQVSLEKAVEQSTAALRDRAAEISSLVASELDHYRRTYLEHSQAQIEETARDLVERQRTKLNETAEMANASFTDRIRRTTEESLRRIERSSRETVEKTRSDMEFTREGALAEFQKTVDERILQGIEQAKAELQAHLRPLVDTMEAERQAQQKQLAEQLQKSGNESIEEYKARLENASNSWLLASATTLGQHSQVVLDTLAKAAEKRLRDTCKNVLAGMGDTLKKRMLDISGDFAPDEDEEEKPPKK